MWLNYGDANTKYFHLHTIQWCSHSRVYTLKDDTGLWLTGEPLLQHITATFKRLFQATSTHKCPSTRCEGQIAYTMPFAENAQSLTQIPQPAEIFRNLKDLPPLKAPGPNGFHALFFQTNWSNLGASIIQVIQEIFEQLSIPPSWGTTNLVLIPKLAHLEMITQFQPISLCNTLYKLVFWIIVQRLKPYMAEIINPC